MKIHAKIRIDDDRWAKRPFGVEFDNEECNNKFKHNGLTSREACERIIERAKSEGYDIDDFVEEEFY